MEEVRGIPIQQDDFCDLIEEDGNVVTAQERQSAVDSINNPEEPIMKDKEVGILKESIELPGNDTLVSEFASGLVGRLGKEHILFYRQDSRQVVELGMVKDAKGEIIQTGFIPIRASRFITLIEKYFWPWATIYKKGGGSFQVKKSMNKDCGNTVLESHVFQEGLPNINRIFTVQNPVILNDKLTFPNVGYDPRFNSWLPENAPKISDMDMDLDVAKDIIYKIFSEFCFETKQDYMNAISALLTPLLRGLFKSGFNTRTPVYCYEANRERSGKDYLAGITGILYEGHALEEPPISNGEYRSSGSNDELRKKLVAAMISGRKRLHFSNNKGHLNNSVLESVTTAERYSDRLLGKNESVTFDNELDFSFSGNLGITLTPDLANRTIFIKLFLEIEDANKRMFETPNLHGWVTDNRDLLLSAMYSLVNNWFKKGCPDGSVPFASFPEWARICGGVMEAAGYENPCKKSKEEVGISIDTETDEMKELFELCYKNSPDTEMDKNDVKTLVMNSNIMPYMQWENRSTQTKFGIKLNKFVGRILSDIRLEVTNKSVRSSRWKYKFGKNMGNIDKKDVFGDVNGNLGNLGNLNTSTSTSTSTQYNRVVQTLPTLPQVTTTPKEQAGKDDIDKLKKDKYGNVSKKDILEFLKEDSKRLILGYGEKDIPIIAAWRTDSVHISFFCPDCKKIHKHGWANGDPNGHRHAHCHNTDSRFDKNGYFICYQGTLSEADNG